MSDHEHHHDNQHQHNEQHHHHHEGEQPQSSPSVHTDENQQQQHSAAVPSAPPAAGSDENGFFVVSPGTDNNNDAAAATSAAVKAELNEIIKDLSASVPTASASAEVKKSSAESKDKCATASESGSPLCPYYMCALNYLEKIELPPKVRDLVLWRDWKQSGAVFVGALVLLISLACCSLFSVIGSLALLALTATGAYRFYLSLIFRIKGTYDDTFDKLSATDISLSADHVQDLSRVILRDVNCTLSSLKRIVLWDNITQSAVACVAFYFVYCLGSVFNTLTLLILALVSAFTLPKVYVVYKRQIDQALAQFTNASHNLVKQVQAKVPFLNKKKTQ